MDDNCYPISDPNTESSHREFKHGHYYNGNTTKNAQENMKGEGSEGLARNQGFIRDSFIPTVEDVGTMSHDNMTRLKVQGSHAQLES